MLKHEADPEVCYNRNVFKIREYRLSFDCDEGKLPNDHTIAILNDKCKIQRRTETI